MTGSAHGGRPRSTVRGEAPTDTSLNDRVPVQNLGQPAVMPSQGTPLFHAGVDDQR